MRAFSSCFALYLVACAAPSPLAAPPRVPAEAPPRDTDANPTTKAPSDPSEATTSSEAQPGTRYRVGDYVIYRYEGEALKAPVTLTEEIVAQDGQRLEIQVTAERGDERRRWIQVVTDSPENRKSDRLDALYLVEDGERKELPNENNADAYRLYDWVIPPVEGPIEDAAQVTERTEIAGESYEMTCKIGKQKVAGKWAEVRYCDSEDFLWTKVRTLIESGEKVLFRMVVQEAGRRAARAE